MVEPEVPCPVDEQPHARHAERHDRGNVGTASTAGDGTGLNRAEQCPDLLHDLEGRIRAGEPEPLRFEHAAVGLDREYMLLEGSPMRVPVALPSSSAVLLVRPPNHADGS